MMGKLQEPRRSLVLLVSLSLCPLLDSMVRCQHAQPTFLSFPFSWGVVPPHLLSVFASPVLLPLPLDCLKAGAAVRTRAHPRLWCC